MAVDQVKQDSMAKIVQLLAIKDADFTTICDLMYHYNKSLGVTLVEIRKQLATVAQNEQLIAIQNLRLAIQKFKSLILF